jgi:hypothetical protein
MITPDEFDTLVRDTLRDVDARMQQHSAGTADRLIANAREGGHTVVAFRRRTNWTAPLLAAAAVIAVVIAAVLVSNGSNGGPVSPATQLPTTNAPSPNSSAPTSSAPTDVTPSPSVAGFKPYDVSYRDPQHGWALGDDRCPTGGKSNCAAILRTTDGGSTWHRIGVPPGLTSTRDSASCGDNGTITGPCVDSIVFATQQIGYLWSYHAFYLTTDGGAHWTNVGTQHVTNVVVIGRTALLMATRAGCSAGCSFGVFAARIGTTSWNKVIPYSVGGAGPWSLAGQSGVAYVLKQFPSERQALYRSTDGTNWTRVTTPWPCGNKAIDTIAVKFDGSLSVTCQ